ELVAGAVLDDSRVDRILDAALEARRNVTLGAAHRQRQTLARGNERAGHSPVGVARDGLEQCRFLRLGGERGEMPRVHRLLDVLELACPLERAEKSRNPCFTTVSGPHRDVTLDGLADRRPLRSEGMMSGTYGIEA